MTTQPDSQPVAIDPRTPELFNALPDAVRAVIVAALADGIDYRDDNGGHCSWCDDQPGDTLCEDHEGDRLRADAYRAVRDLIGDSPILLIDALGSVAVPVATSAVGEDDGDELEAVHTCRCGARISEDNGIWTDAMADDTCEDGRDHAPLTD